MKSSKRSGLGVLDDGEGAYTSVYVPPSGRVRGSKKPSSSGSGSGSGSGSSFAVRVSSEGGPNAVERGYLLGGGGGAGYATSVAVGSRGTLAYNPAEDHQPLTPKWVRRVVGSCATAAGGFSSALLAACLFEYQDSSNADENCPLLLVGAVVAAVSVVVALAGLAAATTTPRGSPQARLSSRHEPESLYAAHHWGAFACTLALIGVAVATLMHWDIGGEPIHDLFHKPETVGVRFRFLVWGLSLAAALSFVASMFGTLGREWPSGEGTFKSTYVAAGVVQMCVGATVFGLGLAVWYHEEVGDESNPVFLIGSTVSGAALFALSSASLSADTFGALSHYLLWLPLVSLPVLAFSIGNAVTAEPQSISPPRHHNQLLSGIVGVWGQVFVVLSIIAASRWRFYLYCTDILQRK